MTSRAFVSWRSARAALLLFAAFGAVALLAGCSGGATDGPKAAQLDGSWTLEALGGWTALKPADPAVTTDMTLAAGAVSGNGGVNSYSGTYEAKDGGDITFSPIAATAMAGPENAMNQESAFFSALDKARHFEFDGDKLVLSDAGNNTLLVLAPR